MIKLYSTGCPKCHVLERKLDDAGLEYIKVTDIAEMKSKGITSAPMLEIDGKFYDFSQSLKFTKERQETKC